VVPCGIKIWQPGTFVPSSCCNGAAGKSDGMKLEELILLLKNEATTGAQRAVGSSLKLSGKITKSEAYRRYGRTSVDRWLNEGLLKSAAIIGKKSTIRIDINKLEAIAANSNRGTYLPVAAR